MAQLDSTDEPPLVQVQTVTRTLQRLQHSGVLAGRSDCAGQLEVLERLEEHTDDFHVRHTSVHSTLLHHRRWHPVQRRRGLPTLLLHSFIPSSGSISIRRHRAGYLGASHKPLAASPSAERRSWVSHKPQKVLA